MKTRTVLKAILPVAVLALAAAFGAYLIATRPEVEVRPPERRPVLVEAVRVRRGPYRTTVRAHGTVRPRTESTLAVQVAGVVVWTSDAWTEGGAFEAGEPLLRIDPSDYELALARAQAEVARAELKLAEEEEEAAVARREWESLGRAGEKPSPLLLREPQLKEARAALDAARALLKRAELDLERTTLRAPYRGRIRETLAAIGQFVPAGGAVARIYARDRFEIPLPVPDSELAWIDVPLSGAAGGPENGRAPVVIRARFAGSVFEWTGAISRTASDIDPRSRMVRLVAEVEETADSVAPAGRPPLLPGLFVEAEIPGRTIEDCAALPRYALREEAEVEGLSAHSDSGGRERRWKVFVAWPDGRLRSRSVEVLRFEGETALIGRGLEEGELVSVTPLDLVIEGMAVRVREVEP